MRRDAMKNKRELERLINTLPFPRRSLSLDREASIETRFKAWRELLNACEQEVLDRLRIHCDSEEELADAYRRWHWAEMERHDREKIESIGAMNSLRATHTKEQSA
jgi:hypothetical protein